MAQARRAKSARVLAEPLWNKKNLPPTLYNVTKTYMTNEQLNDPLLILIFGGSFSLIFFVLGILIYKYKWYGLIAGYNHSPEHIQKQYDIEGLAKHVGQGLMTLAVLLIISTALFYFKLYGWFNASMGVFIFIAFIIPLGAPKFMPEQQRLIKEGSADAKHPILRRTLPTSIYKSLEKKHACGFRYVKNVDTHKIFEKQVVYVVVVLVNQLNFSTVKTALHYTCIKSVERLSRN